MPQPRLSEIKPPYHEDAPDNNLSTDRQRYVYAVEVIGVVDGDTVDVNIKMGKMMVDLGFGQWVEVPKAELRDVRIRFYGMNTPELNSSCENERERAKRAKRFVEEFLSFTPITMKTLKGRKSDKEGKYGRILGIFYNSVESVSLNELLVVHGHANEVYYD